MSTEEIDAKIQAARAERRVRLQQAAAKDSTPDERGDCVRLVLDTNVTTPGLLWRGPPRTPWPRSPHPHRRRRDRRLDLTTSGFVADRADARSDGRMIRMIQRQVAPLVSRP